MLSRRRFLTITAGVTTTALLSACVAPTAAPSTGSASGSAATGAEAVEVSYWALDGENGDDNLVRGVIKPFEEKNPDVKIAMQEIPGKATTISIKP